jgi:cytochrome c-type biogenesis protein CcmF
LWIAVFIALLSGGAQYLRFREMNWKKHAKRFALSMGISLLVSIPLALLISSWTPAHNWQYMTLLITGVFAVVSNLDYLIRVTKGSPKIFGSAFAHMGFGLMIIGIIASGLNQQIISSSPFVMEGLLTNMEDEEGWRKNLLLFKGSPMLMEEYELTYVSDTIDRFDRTYTVNFKRKDKAGNTLEDFNIYPMVQYNKEYTKIASSNPSTKHYWDRDIFTYVSGLPEVEMNFQYRREKEDSLNYRSYASPLGEPILILDTVKVKDSDSITIRQFEIAPIEINRNPVNPDYQREEGDIPIGIKLAVRRLDKDTTFIVEPVIVLRGQLLYTYPSQIDEFNAKLRVGENIFETLLTPEEDLQYEPFELKQGEKFTYEGYEMQFAGFNKSPQHVNYKAEEGDIAVGAMVSIQAPAGQNYMASPVFFIRGNNPYNLKDEIPAEGLHVRFIKLNPKEESATIWVAKSKQSFQVPFELATDSFSSNWIVLQAIEFPGINFFWIGTILMMFGLGWSMVLRARSRIAAKD